MLPWKPTTFLPRRSPVTTFAPPKSTLLSYGPGLYFAQMSCTRRRFIQRSVLAAAIFAANCALVSADAGQNTSAELPANCSAYASIPLPAEAEKAPVPKTFPACASYRSYRGIGRPVNYYEARVCAWQERLAQKAGLGQNQKEATAWVIGGSLILADIYFNGTGVERNIPLAMRLVCESEEGMATSALPDIAKLNAPSRAHELFEFCDYAATTFTMNFCSGYRAEIEDERRTRYYNSLKSSMTPEQEAAFEKLVAAQKAYIDAHASEVYQGGTIRVVRTIRSQNILKDLFQTEVAHFERKKWPVLSDSQIKAADTLLHREYVKKLQELQTQTQESTDEGNITASDLSRVEETWQSYRDAWVAFAGLRYPAAVAVIGAEITLDRYHVLKSIR